MDDSEVSSDDANVAAQKSVVFVQGSGGSIEQVRNAVNDIVNPRPGSNVERSTTTIARTVPPGNVARTSNQFRSTIANVTTGLATIFYPPNTPNATATIEVVRIIGTNVLPTGSG